MRQGRTFSLPSLYVDGHQYIHEISEIVDKWIRWIRCDLTEVGTDVLLEGFSTSQVKDPVTWELQVSCLHCKVNTGEKDICLFLVPVLKGKL